MGLTIEDIIQGLKETYMICCSVFAYDRKKYIDGAIDRLRNYQKIVDIVSLNDEEFKQCGLKELKEILEVIADRSEEDGNDN